MFHVEQQETKPVKISKSKIEMYARTLIALIIITAAIVETRQIFMPAAIWMLYIMAEFSYSASKKTKAAALSDMIWFKIGEMMRRAVQPHFDSFVQQFQDIRKVIDSDLPENVNRNWGSPGLELTEVDPAANVTNAPESMPEEPQPYRFKKGDVVYVFTKLPATVKPFEYEVLSVHETSAYANQPVELKQATDPRQEEKPIALCCLLKCLSSGAGELITVPIEDCMDGDQLNEWIDKQILVKNSEKSGNAVNFNQNAEGSVHTKVMVDHICPVNGRMGIELGVPCNWCGKTE